MSLEKVRRRTWIHPGSTRARSAGPGALRSRPPRGARKSGYLTKAEAREALFFSVAGKTETGSRS
jgi:hypothetical protein